METLKVIDFTIQILIIAGSVLCAYISQTG